MVVPTGSPGGNGRSERQRWRDGQPAVGRRAAVGLLNHHVAHAGNDPAEADHARRCRDRPAILPAAAYSKPRLPGQYEHAGARNGSTTGEMTGGW